MQIFRQPVATWKVAALPGYQAPLAGGSIGVYGGLRIAHLGDLGYVLTDEQLAALDGYEQFVGPGDQHNLYDRETTSVQLVRADDGSFPRRLRVWIYLARSANPSGSPGGRPCARAT